MKNLLTFSLLSFLFFFGCNHDSDVTSPTNNQVKLIPLPASSSGLNVETIYIESMEINGQNYG